MNVNGTSHSVTKSQITLCNQYSKVIVHVDFNHTLTCNIQGLWAMRFNTDHGGSKNFLRSDSLRDLMLKPAGH